jgi:hypothetical protein
MKTVTTQQMIPLAHLLLNHHYRIKHLVKKEEIGS